MLCQQVPSLVRKFVQCSDKEARDEMLKSSVEAHYLSMNLK